MNTLHKFQQKLKLWFIKEKLKWSTYKSICVFLPAIEALLVFNANLLLCLDFTFSARFCLCKSWGGCFMSKNGLGLAIIWFPIESLSLLNLNHLLLGFEAFWVCCNCCVMLEKKFDFVNFAMLYWPKYRSSSVLKEQNKVTHGWFCKIIFNDYKITFPDEIVCWGKIFSLLISFFCLRNMPYPLNNQSQNS